MNPQWDAFVQGLIGAQEDPPAKFRGSRLQWKLQPEHPLGTAEVARLLSEYPRLSPGERQALIGRFLIAPDPALAGPLADLSRRMPDLGSLTGQYQSALLRMIRVASVATSSDVTTEGGVGLPPLQDAMVRSSVTWIRSVGVRAEPSSWHLLADRIGQWHEGAQEASWLSEAEQEISTALLPVVQELVAGGTWSAGAGPLRVARFVADPTVCDTVLTVVERWDTLREKVPLVGLDASPDRGEVLMAACKTLNTRGSVDHHRALATWLLEHADAAYSELEFTALAQAVAMLPPTPTPRPHSARLHELNEAWSARGAK